MSETAGGPTGTAALPWEPGRGYQALPQGCDHIDWAAHHDSAGAGQFTTWVVEHHGDTVMQETRRRELAAQGLAVAGEAHLCQTDPHTGAELWAAPIGPPAGGAATGR